MLKAIHSFASESKKECLHHSQISRYNALGRIGVVFVTFPLSLSVLMCLLLLSERTFNLYLTQIREHGTQVFPIYALCEPSKATIFGALILLFFLVGALAIGGVEGFWSLGWGRSCTCLWVERDSSWERVESQGSLASTSFLLVPPERMKRDKMLVVSLPRTRN